MKWRNRGAGAWGVELAQRHAGLARQRGGEAKLFLLSMTHEKPSAHSGA